MSLRQLVGARHRPDVIECVGLGWHDVSSEADFHQALRLHRVPVGTLAADLQGFRAHVRDGELAAVLETPTDGGPLAPTAWPVPPYAAIETPVRDLMTLAPGAPGHSTVGGTSPTPGFCLDAGGVASPFSFCAHLSRRDSAFAWLPFDLDLAFPFSAELNEPPVWFDYSDPVRPAVVEPFGFITGDMFGLGPEDRVVFEGASLGAVEARHSWTQAGVPNWQQRPEPPRSPTTGLPLDFVVQLDSLGLPRLFPQRLEWPDPSRNGPQFQFWSDGALYVFIESETRLVACVLQTT